MYARVNSRNNTADADRVLSASEWREEKKKLGREVRAHVLVCEAGTLGMRRATKDER